MMTSSSVYLTFVFIVVKINDVIIDDCRVLMFEEAFMLALLLYSIIEEVLIQLNIKPIKSPIEMYF